MSRRLVCSLVGHSCHDQLREHNMTLKRLATASGRYHISTGARPPAAAHTCQAKLKAQATTKISSGPALSSPVPTQNHILKPGRITFPIILFPLSLQVPPVTPAQRLYHGGRYGCILITITIRPSRRPQPPAASQGASTMKVSQITWANAAAQRAGNFAQAVGKQLIPGQCTRGSVEE